MFVERMAVEIGGEGEPVVMIHGLGGTSNTFTPLLAALARHRTIRFDLPGSGRSHRVEGSLSLRLFIERTLLVMQRTGVERAHVVVTPIVGYSFYPAFVEYPGSTSLRLETARDTIVDIARGLDAILLPADSEVVQRSAAARRAMIEYFRELIAQRRSSPRDAPPAIARSAPSWSRAGRRRSASPAPRSA